MLRVCLALGVLVTAILCLPARAGEAPALSGGQTLYVPVYSHIWHGNLDGDGKPQMLLLSSMLSIRNTDPLAGITVLSVKYYDTDGRMLREYYKSPRFLGPMASTDVFIEHKDAEGGTGANFIVLWKSDKPVNPPIVETVNAYFFGSHSLAFTSPGRPIVPPGTR